MKKEKIFRGFRKGTEILVTVDDIKFEPINSNGLSLPMKFDFGNDSLESRQLAYSILAIVFDIDIANRFYVEFVDDVIKIMPDRWTLPESAVVFEAKKINKKFQNERQGEKNAKI